jgi:hypothetical protein
VSKEKSARICVQKAATVDITHVNAKYAADNPTVFTGFTSKQWYKLSQLLKIVINLFINNALLRNVE